MNLAAAAVFTGFAASYTRNQWLTADDTEKRQLRAYVFLRDVLVQQRSGSVFDIIPQWENTGDTQTKNLTSYLNRHLGNMELASGFTYIEIPGGRIVPLLLGPKVTSTISFDNLDKACFEQFNSRKAFNKFYLGGWVRYNDVLTEKSYITRFCWDINQVVFSEDEKSARLSHGLCNEGNCTEEDEYCTEPKGQITVQFPNMSCKPPPQ